METVTRVAQRMESAVSTTSTPHPEVASTLAVTARYVLSEDGRKASLLAGGNGHALQEVLLHVPSSRLHLVSVDRHGVARLKLSPRFEQDDARGLVRIDAAPVYDAPPTLEDLYRAAARNHELESAYDVERVAHRATRRDADRARRDTVAELFLADVGQRAVTHPPPSPKRCYVTTASGRLLFDVASDQGRAKEVPPEAHRRFRADLRGRDERNRQDRAAQLALHDEKKHFIAQWIAANGTDEQKGRQAAGVLPMAEALEGITDREFVIAGGLPRYSRDGAERLQRLLQESTGSVDIVAAADVVVRSTNAVTATAAQWATIQDLRHRIPDATVVLRQHVISLRRHDNSPSVTVFGVLVTRRHGPFVLRREYRLN